MSAGLRHKKRPERFTWTAGQATVRSGDGEELSRADTLPLGESPPEVVVAPAIDAEVADMEAARKAGLLEEEAYGVDS